MTIRSQLRVLAVSTIAAHGCSATTETSSQTTPAALAASRGRARRRSAILAMSLSYCSRVSVTMIGSVAITWNGGTTVSTVTFASSVLARVSPCLTASSESGEPSVGMRMCLYMVRPALLGPTRGQSACQTGTQQKHNLGGGKKTVAGATTPQSGGRAARSLRRTRDRPPSTSEADQLRVNARARRGPPAARRCSSRSRPLRGYRHGPREPPRCDARPGAR